MRLKIGVYVCECGPNIAERVDIDRVIKVISSLEEFEDIELVVKRYKLLCSNDGQAFLKNEIESNALTHLVVAACSPRDHESTFMNVCKKTNLNPYLFNMVNIREHCAWVIPDKAKATEKAIRSIRAGIRRTLHQSELLERELDANPDVLIVGGGIAGMEAALMLADEKRKVCLIEKTERLGGKSIFYSQLLSRQGNSAKMIQQKIEAVQQNAHIQVFTETELESVVGFFGNFEIVLKVGKETELQTGLKAGAIVIATGFRLLNPNKLPQTVYQKEDEVYTTLEVESMILNEGKISLKSGKSPQSIALVHCVGRDEKGYCSTICCSTIIKIARMLKAKLPQISIRVYYRDLCLPHKTDQQTYEEVKAEGVDFIRVKEAGIQNTSIEYTQIDGVKKKESADMVILAPAMEPADGTEALAELLNVSLGETGFFQEAHHHLNPVATSIEGIYIVGAAQGPKGISESVAQAQAVSGKILNRLIPGEKIVPEVKVCKVLEDFCTGCQTCLEVCCYGAISFNEVKGVSVVNEAVCRGCGNCVASCPSGAMRAIHFTTPQLYREMIEAIR
ncbi:CoB--CoM heterodisulfide reductase iron-sulfur subunit A family protein [bacterium]|nr:CoB--CoM heterodisulfide reductase iron-sulfur subunit A family protein [bacterium]